MRATRLPSRFVAQLGAVAAVLVVLGAAGTASAREEFPGAIQQYTKGACVPECTLCHTRPEGGSDFLKPNDITSPAPPANLGGPLGEGAFFANLIHVNVAARILPNDTTKLLGFLKNLEKNPCDGVMGDPICDSDGDEMADVLELRADRDPDVPEAKGAKGECHTPQYGCGASIGTLPHESSATGRAAALMALMGAGLVLARRARRR